MKRSRPSITAEGIAAVRAVESAKPAGERVCYDPLARRLVSPFYYYLTKLLAGYGEWRAPGTMGFLVARARFIDDTLQACLDAPLEDRIKQLVILGAGLDSRAYRFAGLQEGVKAFEVDRPATQAEKRRKLGQVLGRLPEHVTFVPLDFNHESLDKLFDFGYERRVKTLFIWEGVTYYLAAAAVDGTLGFVGHNSGPGSSIVFDYVYASALTAAHKRGEIARMQRYGRFTGERLTFGIEEGRVGEFLAERGFVQVENVTAEDLQRRYFGGPNRDRTIAPIYAIVHARVG
jgi:methyltransferase (TIGR00027 family)